MDEYRRNLIAAQKRERERRHQAKQPIADFDEPELKPTPQGTDDMRMSDAFPSNYVAHTDVMNRPTLQIAGVQMEKVGDDMKPILYFQNAKKGLVLNKTNGTMIAQLYGDDTDQWTGQHVTLYVIDTEFQGKPVKGIRVSPPDAGPRVNDQQAPQGNAGQFTPAQYSNATQGGGDVLGGGGLDDEIPF